MKKLTRRISAAALCVMLAAYPPAAAFAEELILSDSPEEIMAEDTASLPESFTEDLEYQETGIYSDENDTYAEELVIDEGAADDEAYSFDDGELITGGEMSEGEEGSSSAWTISENNEFPADEALEDVEEEILSEDLLSEENAEEEEFLLENEEETEPAEVSLDEGEEEPADEEGEGPEELPSAAYTMAERSSSSKTFSIAFEPDLSIRMSDSSIVSATLTRGEPDEDGKAAYTVRFTGVKPGIGYVQVYWNNEGEIHNVITYRITVAQRVYVAAGDSWSEEFTAAGVTAVTVDSTNEAAAVIEASVNSETVTAVLTAYAKGTAWLSINTATASGGTTPVKKYYVTVVQTDEVTIRQTKSVSYRFTSTSEPDIRFTNHDEAVVSGSASVTGPDEEDKYRITVTLTGESVGETLVYMWNRSTLIKGYHVTVTERFPNPTITVDPTSLRLFTGKTVQIKVSGLVEEDKVVSWKSDKESVASVNSSGLVTAKSAGSAKITVTLLSGLTKTIAVTVVKPTISVKVSSSSLKVGEKGKVSVTCSSGDKVVSYTSGNTSVLSVDSAGNITAKKAGSTSVTVKLDSGISGSVKVNVTIDAPKVTACYNSINGIGVYWNPVSSADSYEIYRANAGKRVRVTSVGKDASSYMDASVKDNCWGRVYVYYVRAKSGSVLSGWGTGFTVQRVAPPSIYYSRSNSVKTVTIGWEALSGTVNKANGYELQYAESREDLYNRTGTSKTVEISGRYVRSKRLSGLKSGKTYYFRMRSYVYYTHSGTGKTTKTWSQFSNVRAVKIR